MVCLSFQEFLSFFGITQDAYTKEELIQHYYTCYHTFTKKHHIYSNGFDVWKEWQCVQQKDIV